MTWLFRRLDDVSALARRLADRRGATARIARVLVRVPGDPTNTNTSTNTRPDACGGGSFAAAPFQA